MKTKKTVLYHEKVLKKIIVFQGRAVETDTIFPMYGCGE